MSSDENKPTATLPLSTRSSVNFPAEEAPKIDLARHVFSAHYLLKVLDFIDTDRILLLGYVNMARSGLSVKTKQDASYGGTRIHRHL